MRDWNWRRSDPLIVILRVSIVLDRTVALQECNSILHTVFYVLSLTASHIHSYLHKEKESVMQVVLFIASIQSPERKCIAVKWWKGPQWARTQQCHNCMNIKMVWPIQTVPPWSWFCVHVRKLRHFSRCLKKFAGEQDVNHFEIATCMTNQWHLVDL